MGWAALIHHTSYEEAHEIADRYDLACVSCRQFEKQLGEWPTMPIVTRIKNGKHWYNYFENSKYKKTLVVNTDGTIPLSYAPYYYMPDRIRYMDLLGYIRQHLLQFKGIYHPYILYYTRDRQQVIYSVFLGVIHSPLLASFENPLLFFESGKPNVPRGPKKKKVENDQED